MSNYLVRFWNVLEKCGVPPAIDEQGNPQLWVTPNFIAVEVKSAHKDAAEELLESVSEFDWVESTELSNGNFIVKAEVLKGGKGNEQFI